MKYFWNGIFVLMLGFSVLSYGQNNSFEIRGTILSFTDNLPIDNATVHLETVKDSTLVTYTVSDEKGFFTLKDKVSAQKIKLFISHLGKVRYSKIIPLPAKNMNMGTVLIKEEDQLEEILIKSTAPITIKKDTLEFNTAAFKMKKDAVVEDLLKKLPGIVVEGGSIMINGKKVDKILVNGKPFFSNDLQIVTKNLSSEVIDKVQVTDTKSKLDAFVGKKAKGDKKTINLKLKKEYNQGGFGNVSVNGGTNNRYKAMGFVNYFRDKQRVGVLAGSNNVNIYDFDYRNGSSNMRQTWYSNGLAVINKIAGNYNNQIGASTDIMANYTFSKKEPISKSKYKRTTVLPKNTYTSLRNVDNVRDEDNHKFNANVDFKLTPKTMVTTRTSFNYDRGQKLNTQKEESFDANNQKINTSSTTNTTTSLSKSVNNTIEIAQKIKEKSNIRLTLKNSYTKSDKDRFHLSTVKTFGTTPRDTKRNQHTKTNNKNLRTRANLRAIIFPFDKHFSLNISYNYSYRRNDNLNTNNNFNDVTEKYDLLNKRQSQDALSKNINHTKSVALNYNKNKHRFNVGFDLNSQNITNEDALRPERNIDRQFNNIFATNAFYGYDAKSFYAEFAYDYTNTLPSIRQLQSFVDLSNPLNITVGNPDLKITRQHQFATYLGVHNRKGSMITFNAVFKKHQNQIVSKSTIDDKLIRTNTYENVSGAYEFNAGIRARKVFKINQNLKLPFGMSFSGYYDKEVSFFNGQKYNGYFRRFNFNTKLGVQYAGWLDVRLRYRISPENAQFDLSHFKEQNFISHMVVLNHMVNFTKKLQWWNEFSYYYNPNVGEEFNPTSLKWNIDLTYKLRDRLLLKITAYDLLNQMNSTGRYAYESYIEDVEHMVLRRYFLVGLTWKFKK